MNDVIAKPNKVLLAFLGEKDRQEYLEIISNLSKNAWYQIIKESNRHLVSSLLYLRFKQRDLIKEIPPQVQEVLHKIYLHNSAINLKKYHTLAQILKILNQADIPVIVLKGGYLIENVYQNIGARELCDFDLLFQKKDLAMAEKVLLRAGYYSKDCPVLLDLHWYVEQYLNINMARIWQRAEPATIAGQKVMSLSPEDLIVHLCVHNGFHHLFQKVGLRALCDLQATIGHFEQAINWDQLIAVADEWGVRDCVALCLQLTNDLLGTPVPNKIPKKLKSSNFDPLLLNWARTQIFDKSSDKYGQKISIYFWKLWSEASWREKLASFKRLIFPSSEYLSQKYPTVSGSSTNKLFYLLRLWDHLGHYCSVLWQILMRNPEMLREIEKQNKNITIMKKLAKDAIWIYR
ncbi:hypothetical protein DBT_0973 [Dissulfuribacter thermophilus]|uniref:Nucleotidyltransferase family protein n=1 Tax=Dissulfuribacter thermophilus TaxID=1156395 RepID=A0A1B9F6T1_9BACT|nr:nucleotidyltransferase family protein [Dissulfuribacter thermophilus]OCC15622.1 hypothetical protein DBT_0973 [Dissulfuribacter thermophilus]